MEFNKIKINSQNLNWNVILINTMLFFRGWGGKINRGCVFFLANIYLAKILIHNVGKIQVVW